MTVIQAFEEAALIALRYSSRRRRALQHQKAAAGKAIAEAIRRYAAKAKSR